MPLRKIETSYHHGDLKNALIRGYLTLLEELPANQISLRKLATYLGVAPTAVYNHFSSKEALTTAVRVELLHHFGDFLEHGLQGLQNNNDASPEDAIFNLAKGYHRYSMEFRTYFDILFSEKVPEAYVTQDLIEAGLRSESLLRVAIGQLLSKHKIAVDDYDEIISVFACWSLMHGLSVLTGNQINRAAFVTKRWPEQLLMLTDDAVDKTIKNFSTILIQGVLAFAESQEN